MPPTVRFVAGDIVDESTEGLVCSGNIELNMSGGVNGALLSRGGAAMQAQLHNHLRDAGKAHEAPGFVMEIGPEPFSFRCIVYTVAVDGWHGSSVELVTNSLTAALEIIQSKGCRSVAVPALATGFGNLPKSEFGVALRRSLTARDWRFRDVRVVHRSEADLAEVERGYAGSQPRGDT